MSGDYYLILGVSQAATASEIKARFRFLSHAYHPDKFGTDVHKQTAEEEFKRINEAYQILSDPSQRASYDGLRARSSPPPPQREQAPQDNPSRSQEATSYDNSPPPRQAPPSRPSYFPRDLPSDFHRPTAELAHKRHCQVNRKMLLYKRVALWVALVFSLAFIVCLFSPGTSALEYVLLIAMLSCLGLSFRAHRNATVSDAQARKVGWQLYEDTRRQREMVEGLGPVSKDTKVLPNSAWTPDVARRAEWAYGYEQRLLPTDVIRAWSFNLAGGGASGLSIQRGQIIVASCQSMAWSN